MYRIYLADKCLPDKSLVPFAASNEPVPAAPVAAVLLDEPWLAEPFALLPLA